MTVLGVVGVVGPFALGVAGLVYGSVENRRRVRLQAEYDYDAYLRRLRLETYPKLWTLLQPFAKYARPSAPGYPLRADLAELEIRLRRWYFETGGLYLSPGSRDAYFLFMDELSAIVQSSRWSDEQRAQLPRETFEQVRKTGSFLRTAITYDLGTRRRFSLAPDDATEMLEAEELKDAVLEAWPPNAPQAVDPG